MSLCCSPRLLSRCVAARYAAGYLEASLTYNDIFSCFLNVYVLVAALRLVLSR